MILLSREHLAMFGDVFDGHDLERIGLLTSRTQRPGMLLTSYNVQKSHTTAKNYAIHNVNNAEVEKTRCKLVCVNLCLFL